MEYKAYVRVLNPNSPNYQSLLLESCYRRHEQEKSKYEQRVTRIEHASFTPIIIVLSCTGGTSKTTSTFMKRLALLLADKRDISYGFTGSEVDSASYLSEQHLPVLEDVVQDNSATPSRVALQ